MTLHRTLVASLTVFLFAGCEIDPDQVAEGLGLQAATEQAPDEPSSTDDGDAEFSSDGDEDWSAPTNTPSPAAQVADPGPAVNPACGLDMDVDFDVNLHTLYVNGGLFVDARFEWAATGGSGLAVDVEFKTSASSWTIVAADLDAVDVTTVDMSQHVGPAASWHFRAIAYHPDCPEEEQASRIVTIQNY